MEGPLHKFMAQRHAAFSASLTMSKTDSTSGKIQISTDRTCRLLMYRHQGRHICTRRQFRPGNVDKINTAGGNVKRGWAGGWKLRDGGREREAWGEVGCTQDILRFQQVRWGLQMGLIHQESGQKLVGKVDIKGNSTVRWQFLRVWGQLD